MTYLKAILEINPNAQVTITVPQGETETYEMITWNKPEEQIDKAILDAKVSEIATRDAHIIPRQNSYPSIQEQLDDIFHNGIDGWKETIQAVKDKYPKE